VTTTATGRAHGRTPPGPPFTATPVLLRQLATDRLGMLGGANARYGDAVRMAVGPRTMYLFNHPDHAKHVLADNSGNYHKGVGYVESRRALGDGLLTSDGELWKRQRRTVQPVFQAKRIAEQAGLVATEAGKLITRLAAHREPVDVLEELTSFTLTVLGQALMDADLGAYEGVGEAFAAVQDQAMFEMQTMGMVPRWLPLPRQLRFRRARAELGRIVDDLVAQRARDPRPDGDDLLSRLIGAGADEPDRKLARQRLEHELITLLLAGHETTASTLGWTLHLLAGRPDVRERLHAEAVAVLGDRLPEYDDLHRLPVATMVLQETMRLRPPVWILTRKALADDEVGGYHVPARSDVLICPYLVHRNPEFWPEAEKFDPDRFDPDQPNTRPRYAYLPFGAGPRFCVGNNLGLLEATFVLTLLARDLDLTPVPGHRVVPEPMLSLRLGGGLPMTVRPART
jgi:enediyne biosynthesis protein E7